MAQKINPISLRLGLTQVWDSTLQNYGKLFKNYSMILHSQLQVYQFLIQFFNSHNILLGVNEFKHYNNKILINVYHSNSLFSTNSNRVILPQIFDTVSEWFSGEVSLRLHSNLQWFSTAALISKYTQYLLKQNTSPNKVLWNLCRLLQVQLNSKKVVYSVSGPIEANLIGFKVCLSGRFDNSRNQMAKSNEQKIGSLPLMSLQSHVEFTNSQIYTKLGTCGLQIWLFYKIY